LDNRKALRLADGASTAVTSVRQSLVPVGVERFSFMRETIAEYVQVIRLTASELRKYGIRKPNEMPNDLNVSLHGGGTLVFDQNGQLKYHIQTNVLNAERTSAQIAYLWNLGLLRDPLPGRNPFAAMHRQRQLNSMFVGGEI